MYQPRLHNIRLAQVLQALPAHEDLVPLVRPNLVLEDKEQELGLQVVEDAEGQAEQTPLHLRWVSRDVVLKLCVFDGELHLDVDGVLDVTGINPS